MTDYEEVTIEITLTNGTVLIGHRIPPNDLELFEDEHIGPKPPMREAKAAGGTVEMVPDTEDEAYQELLDAFKIKKQEDLRRLVFDHVELKEEPTPEELAKLSSWGISLTKENIIRHHMADYFVDWLIIRDEIMRISVVTEVEVQRALERFRRHMGGGAPPDADGDSKKSVSGGGRKSAGDAGS